MVVPGWMTHVAVVTWTPCGNKVMYDSRKSKKIYEAINFYPELSFEHDDSHWKYLDEQKMMVPSRRGLTMIEEK